MLHFFSLSPLFIILLFIQFYFICLWIEFCFFSFRFVVFVFLFFSWNWKKWIYGRDLQQKQKQKIEGNDEKTIMGQRGTIMSFYHCAFFICRCFKSASSNGFSIGRFVFVWEHELNRTDFALVRGVIGLANERQDHKYRTVFSKLIGLLRVS